LRYEEPCDTYRTMMTTFSLGERIRSARTLKGWTQTDLAVAAEITRGDVAHYEMERRDPTVPKLKAICKALDLDANALLGLPRKKTR
jgi:transcriptional regulator with XRE-family HTH domain